MARDRYLAAIVIADVVGYSKLMAEDEEGTLAALRAHRNVTDPVILNSGGRIVKNLGDGVLLEFGSAVAAVNASVEIQAIMAERNERIPDGRRMQFRFGINLGDVIADESGDIFGDGINVAARLESVAPPGGIAVSHAVREAVRGKVDIQFADGGEHTLKNIPRPVRVWFAGAAPVTSASPVLRTTPRTLATIAVMPFTNMSGDTDQQYFADGITEDLLIALSRDRDLAVIARNASFAYRSTDKDLRSVARELDATHIVEGSVRRAGDRVRVTANLIDAEAGRQLWAERFDGELDDIFTLQDELVDSITARLRPTLFERAARATEARPDRTVDAWDLTLRGQHEVNRNTVDGFLAGIELLDRAHDLSPTMADPVGKCAVAWLHLVLTGWRQDGVNPWDEMTNRAELAYRLDANNYDALAAMAAARSYGSAPLEGAEFARRMIDLNRHGAFGYHWLGHNLGFAGLRDEGIPVLTDAWRLGRYEPWRHHVATNLAYAHYFNHDFASALNWARKSAQLADLLQAHIILAAAGSQLGDEQVAGKYASAILQARPQFTCERYRPRIPFVIPADQDLLIEGLERAGLPT